MVKSELVYHTFLHNQSDSQSVNTKWNRDQNGEAQTQTIDKQFSEKWLFDIKKWIFGCFQWWCLSALSKCKCVFLKFDIPKASSACSERLFSGGKLVLETKCNRHDDENFEKLLLLNFGKNF